ncbi:protein a6 isoform X1 [Drosophila mauritiana]|uniref:Protein a6 isoform X1 n=2 Tax=Drosophila mauritiana TaxID=7226 RepID=A0A6P8L6L7_DROMA|nr:protein a6 isoform X1 [Drosophila mauritiana]
MTLDNPWQAPPPLEDESTHSVNMNQRHSEPFYISPRLFDNRRLKRRRCRWMERLLEHQRICMARMRAQAALASKTDRQLSHLQRRHVAATLQADVTIDLLSDDDETPSAGQSAAAGHNRLLIPAPGHRAPRVGRRQAPRRVATHSYPVTDSILITSDDEHSEQEPSSTARVRSQLSMRSPPPLAPLTQSETIEEVTVSLVPRTSTTANCLTRVSGHPKPCRASTAATNGFATAEGGEGGNETGCFLEVDVGGGITATLPDETTVHTVIANRIYELSLSKLREGLAFSGVPEYTHDLMPEQLQKLSPALRAKVAPLVAPSPPTPISLKLSSDLSISLISDEDECESTGPHANGGVGTEPVHPVVVAAAEAHAAAKLLKQQQPQLSVVQHLQYVGGGLAAPVALALPVMAANPTSSASVVALPLQLPRRRKLG